MLNIFKLEATICLIDVKILILIYECRALESKWQNNFILEMCKSTSDLSLTPLFCSHLLRGCSKESQSRKPWLYYRKPTILSLILFRTGSQFVKHNILLWSLKNGNTTMVTITPYYDPHRIVDPSDHQRHIACTNPKENVCDMWTTPKEIA